MKTLNDIKDTKCLHIAFSSELKQKLVNEAREKGLTLNSYIRMILTEFVNNRTKEKNEE